MNAPHPQKIFLSRTTNGLADTALKCEAILKERGCEVIHQPDFTGSWRDVKGMLVDKLIACDAAICLVGPACGMMMHEPVTGLKDPRTEDRHSATPSWKCSSPATCRGPSSPTFAAAADSSRPSRQSLPNRKSASAFL